MPQRSIPTEKQNRVLDAIKALTSERGMPPTIREIMERCQFRSPNAVTMHLLPLESRGLIVWIHGTSRGVLLANAAEKTKLLAKLAALDIEDLQRIVQQEGA